MPKPLLNLLFLVVITPAVAFAQIDVDRVLFGVEYTFQDQAMVDEPGRNTVSTPYKEEKVRLMAEAYRKLRGLPRSAITVKTSWKPGLYIHVPGEPKYVINSEPVTVEFNTGPKTLSQLKEAAIPIFQAAEQVGLVGYVNPAAERSGMGHVHIGGRTIRESPWGQNPHLLRNVFAYLHKHPAMLYGFSEAYDLGNNSNIETFHNDVRQEALTKVIAEYDRDVADGKIRQPLDGLYRFLELLVKYDSNKIGFFEHYRFLNLEHLRSQVNEMTPDKEGKFTVEFRNFRPPASADHTEAVGRLLLSLLHKLSTPGHLEKFERISRGRFLNFMSASRIEADWQVVRRDLDLRDPLTDSMILEYVNVMTHTRKPVEISGYRAEISRAYSEKEFKGSFFEVRILANQSLTPPLLAIDNNFLNFEKIKIARAEYWVAVVNTRELKIPKQRFFNRPDTYIKKRLGGSSCRLVHPIGA